MADQVNPAGSMASGASLTLLSMAAPKPAPEKARVTKTVESLPQGQAGASAESAQSAEVAMTQVNDHLEQTGTELRFRVDKATGRTVFKIVNPDDGRVLLQVPSDEMLALARNLKALDEQMRASGVLVDREG